MDLQEKKSEAEIRVRVFGRTDVGLLREHNEDNFLVADLTAGNRSIKPEVRSHTIGKKGSLFVVCDGMGGAAAGEVASRIGIDTIYEQMQVSDAAKTDEDLAKKLETAILEAGMRILTAAKVDRGQRGMGTTVTAAVIKGPRLIIGQVGDSRAYILRGDKFVQVTKDQSLVQQLIDAKQLTEEEARNFERTNIILQALGTAEKIQVDMTSVELRQGDVLIMCSDGLTGPVAENDIKKVLMATDDLQEACKELTDMACKGGGQDNITVIIAKFEGAGLWPSSISGDLEYRKFNFSTSLGDTNPHMLAVKLGKAQKSSKIGKRFIDYFTEATKRAKPRDQGQRRKGLIAAAAIVLIGAAFGGYFFVSGSSKRSIDEDGRPIDLGEVPLINGSSDSNNKQGTGNSSALDKQTGSILPPTSQEAILETGTVGESGLSQDNRTKNRLGKIGESKDKKNEQPDETMTGESDEQAASREDEEPTSPKTKLPDKPKETLQNDKQKEKPVVEPAPIDDNPF